MSSIYLKAHPYRCGKHPVLHAVDRGKVGSGIDIYDTIRIVDVEGSPMVFDAHQCVQTEVELFEFAIEIAAVHRLVVVAERNIVF